MEETQATVDDLYQPQDSKSDEEADQVMTESLVCSGMKSLATCDDTLSQDEERKLVKVVKDKLPKEDNPGSRVGKRLADMADEIDGIIASDSDINNLPRTLKNKESWDQLKQYFTGASEQIVGPDRNISEGRILMIVMLGYRLVKRYLMSLLGEEILECIEKIVSLIYEVFKRYGILNWILNIGGWAVLAARRTDVTMLHGIYNVIPVKGIWGILGAGATVVAGFCMYKAITA